MTTVEASRNTQFVLETPAIDLGATLDGGQAFRWWEVPGSERTAFDGVIGRVAVRISEATGGIQVTVRAGEPAPGFAEQVADYLGLGADLEALQAAFADDPCIGPAITGFPGLRLLRQDPWECLSEFICSSTSNIPRIKLNVGALAADLGERIGPGDTDFAFPTPKAVAAAGEMRLRELGWGFRAKFLVPAAEEVASGRLDLFALRTSGYYEARDALTALNGVGEKIADCVMAFSLDKPEAFPIDRHIRRALEKWYGLPEKINNSKAGDWARERFGNTGAIGQQYMFHRERLSRRAESWGGRHLDSALVEDRSRFQPER